MRIRLLMLAVMVANVFHLAIHGTFLDGGALDSTLEALNVWAMTHPSL